MINDDPRPLHSMMTDIEHEAVRTAGHLWNLVCEIAGDGWSRSGDLAQIHQAIHTIQHAVMKNAAARAYPEMYRLLGGDALPIPGEN